MAVGEEIFPKECWMAYLDNGQLSPMGNLFMNQQRMDEWQGNGAEHPCYGCLKDDCTVRQVTYHDTSKRYIIRPKMSNII